MWPPPFSRPTRRRRRIHINLADFYAPVELIFGFHRMAALPSPAPGRFPPAGAIATMAATRARRLRADLTSSQPTKDDHRGNQTKHENRDATELACGCGVFPRRTAARDAPAVWCFLPPGRVEKVACSSLSPRLGRSPHGSEEQMFGTKQQVPVSGRSD